MYNQLWHKIYVIGHHAFNVIKGQRLNQLIDDLVTLITKIQTVLFVKSLFKPLHTLTFLVG